MTLAGKIITVIVLKAVLLSVNAGDRVPTDGYAMAQWGSVGYDADGIKRCRYPQFAGERVLQDNLAGLTIVVEPSREGTDLFGSWHGGQPDVQEQILRPTQDGSWPDVEFDFPIPRTGSTYFMEEVEENLFRRVEFSGRAGFGAHLSMSPVADGVAVDLQLNRRLLSAPSFEETLDAWLAKPTLTRVTLGTQLLLPTDKQVLVVVAPGGAGAEWDPDQARPAGAEPLGFAVLLEMRQWEFLPAPAELRREFEPLATALEAATGGRARLDLQNTHTPATPDLSPRVAPPEHGYLTVVPITTQGDEPALIGEGKEQYAPVMALRVGREAEVRLRHSSRGGYGTSTSVRTDADRKPPVPGGSPKVHRDQMSSTAFGGHNQELLGPGVYVLAQSRGDDAGLALFAANEDGSALVRPTERSGGSIGGMYGSDSTRTGLPAGAPTIPFAEFEGWGQMVRTGAQFCVWFPSGGVDGTRQSITVGVAEPAAGQRGSGYGSSSNRGGSSYGSSSRSNN